MAVEGDFEPYGNTVMQIIMQAGTSVSIPSDADEDFVEYVNTLRVAVIEACVGIIRVRSTSVMATKMPVNVISNSPVVTLSSRSHLLLTALCMFSITAVFFFNSFFASFSYFFFFFILPFLPLPLLFTSFSFLFPPFFSFPLLPFRSLHFYYLILSPQGMSEAKKEQALLPYLQGIGSLILLAGNDPQANTEVLKAVIGLIGDMGDCLGQTMRQFYEQESLRSILATARGHDDSEEFEDILNWTIAVKFPLNLLLDSVSIDPFFF